MTGRKHYQHWLLAVRERLVRERIEYDPKFDWRAQFDDGQNPQAAIEAFKRR